MEDKEKLKVTSFDDLQKVRQDFKEGKIVELPAFDIEYSFKKDNQKIDKPVITNKKPFFARLKRLSMLGLCKSEQLPNTLLAAAQEIYEGRQRGDIKKYSEVLDIIASIVMVEPTFEEVKDILTDAQKVGISTYAQSGVMGLLPFRKVLGFDE